MSSIEIKSDTSKNNSSVKIVDTSHDNNKKTDNNNNNNNNDNKMPMYKPQMYNDITEFEQTIDSNELKENNNDRRNKTNTNINLTLITNYGTTDIDDETTNHSGYGGGMSHASPIIPQSTPASLHGKLEDIQAEMNMGDSVGVEIDMIGVSQAGSAGSGTRSGGGGIGIGVNKLDLMDQMEDGGGVTDMEIENTIDDNDNDNDNNNDNSNKLDMEILNASHVQGSLHSLPSQGSHHSSVPTDSFEAHHISSIDFFENANKDNNNSNNNKKRNGNINDSNSNNTNTNNNIRSSDSQIETNNSDTKELESKQNDNNNDSKESHSESSMKLKGSLNNKKGLEQELGLSTIDEHETKSDKNSKNSKNGKNNNNSLKTVRFSMPNVLPSNTNSAPNTPPTVARSSSAAVIDVAGRSSSSPFQNNNRRRSSVARRLYESKKQISGLERLMIKQLILVLIVITLTLLLGILLAFVGNNYGLLTTYEILIETFCSFLLFRFADNCWNKTILFCINKCCCGCHTCPRIKHFIEEIVINTKNVVRQSFSRQSSSPLVIDGMMQQQDKK